MTARADRSAARTPWWAVALAAYVLSLLANQAIGWAERVGGAPADFDPAKVPNIALMTTLGMAAGTAVFLALRRFRGATAPWWRRIGYAALVASFAIDIPFFGQVPTVYVLATMFMHVVSGVLLIEGLARADPPGALAAGDETANAAKA